MRAMRSPGLRALRGRHCGRRTHRSLPTGWRRDGASARAVVGALGIEGRSRSRAVSGSPRCRHHRGTLHRLRPLSSGLSCPCDRRCVEMDAHGHCGSLYWLRALHRAVSRRLHRDDSSEHGCPRAGTGGVCACACACARAPRRGTRGGSRTSTARAARHPAHERRIVNAAKRQLIFERLREAIPAPATELEYATPFELLVAVILSAQATDVSVNKATERLFKVARTPAALLALGLDGLTEYIKNLGLYNTKAKNILATCQALIDRHDGEVPRDREALESLPGVGRKTANVVLNTAFGEETIAVDTHIFRVANRTKLAPGKNVRAVEDRLLRVVPAEVRKGSNHWLILHGRYVCTARNPRCDVCPIFELCEWRGKSRARRGETRPK